MIEIKFTHRGEDGSESTFSNDSRDIFVWEKTDRDGRSFISTFEHGMPRMIDLYKLAWITAKRQGLVRADLSLDRYAEQFTISVDAEDITEPDPTPATASATG